MPRFIKMVGVAGLIGITVSGVCPVLAQAPSSQTLHLLDRNSDGKISRAEVSEGVLKRVFDRMVEQYKIDPEKTYSREELERLLGVSGPSASAPFRPSAAPAGPSRTGQRVGSRSISQPLSIAPMASRRAADGRRFRSLVELPQDYRTHDQDGDGQIGLYEWPRERIAEFISLDKNDDGFLTINELKKPRTNAATKQPDSPQRSHDTEHSVAQEEDGYR